MHNENQVPETQDQTGRKPRKQRSDKGVKRGPRKPKTVDNAVGSGD